MTKINQQSNTLIQLWTKNNTIVRKLDANLGAIHGIGFTEYLVLHHLYAAPQMLLRRIDLADLLARSASGVTKMLNPMEKIGLVSKAASPRDARVSLVKLTTTGERTYQQATQTLHQITTEVFHRIKAVEVENLYGLLENLAA